MSKLARMPAAEHSKNREAWFVRMRKGWRNTFYSLVLLALGGQVSGARVGQVTGPADPPVRLALEISWTSPAVPGEGEPATGAEIQLEVSPGEVVDALAWPSGTPPERLASGAWKLGTERSGRIRAKVEAPLASSVLIRVGQGPPMRFPLTLILEGSRRTPSQSSVEVMVERLPWDMITVDLGAPNESGVAAPGAKVPLSVGFNIVTPDAGQAAVHCVAELKPIRGGQAVWTSDFRETVPTNQAAVTTWALPLQMPTIEGTYVLELRASWVPLIPQDGGTAIGRLLRRGRRNLLGGLVGGLVGGGASTRKVTLAVVDPAMKPDNPASSPARLEHDQEVDAIDLTRSRNTQRLTAAGRARPVPADPSHWPIPEEALAETPRRDRLRGWISRGDSEASRLAPADASGFAWTAMGLKVNHPGRPHRLSLAISAGHPSSLGVAMVGPSGVSGKPRLLLDACASGPPVLPAGPPVMFSWLVWPDAHDPVLILVNRATEAPVQIGALNLTELAEIPSGPAIEEPGGGAKTRGLGLQLSGPQVFERFGIAVEPGIRDPLMASRSLGQYLTYCGTSVVVLSDGLADRKHRQGLGRQAAEDSIGPDALEIAVATLGRFGISTWVDLSFAGALPGLPDPNSAEAMTRGLVRVDKSGRPDGAEYHALNSEVRDAMKKRVTQLATSLQAANGAKLAGILIRLGRGPTLLGAPDTGIDDPTFGAFLGDAFDPDTAKSLPGVDPESPERFLARTRFIAGSGRMPWLTYRSKRIAELYMELAKAAREQSPGLKLAVATPGSAAVEARKADLNDLAPSLAWRAVGLDFDAWPNDESSPIVFRGISLSTDDLAHDLATHPDLDAKITGRFERGVIMDIDEVVSPASKPGSVKPVRPTSLGNQRGGLVLSALPLEDGPTDQEPLGHALAALDARWVVVAAPAALGREERIRSFAKVFRSLPVNDGPVQRQPMPFGVSLRTLRSGDQTYLALANDTPYPIRLDTVLNAPKEANVYDFARAAMLKPVESDKSGRHLVLDLVPFGVASVRIGAPDVKLGSVTPYPSNSVLATMQTRYNELSSQLARLSRGVEKGRSVPANPGFEPEAPDQEPVKGSGMEAKVIPVKVKSAQPKGELAATGPVGWNVVGGKGNALTIDLEQPKSGRGSLLLQAKTPPASAASEAFTPEIHSAILVRAWFRADRADAKIRVWIEGEAGGRPFRRVSELSIGKEWTERAVRAADVPTGGLDSAQIRFEMPSAGNLWIDDLIVTGDTLSEPERRNARNALLAALQAYQEKRYADFARLAGSHWARHPGVITVPRRIAEGQLGGPPGLSRAGDDSAPLPEGRRLR